MQFCKGFIRKGKNVYGFSAFECINEAKIADNFDQRFERSGTNSHINYITQGLVIDRNVVRCGMGSNMMRGTHSVRGMVGSMMRDMMWGMMWGMMRSMVGSNMMWGMMRSNMMGSNMMRSNMMGSNMMWDMMWDMMWGMMWGMMWSNMMRCGIMMGGSGMVKGGFMVTS